MAFELPELPYAYDALEPHIDAETMRIHHDLHHKAYVDNANAALAGTDLADHSIRSVLTNLRRCRRTARRCAATPATTRITASSGDHVPRRRRRVRRLAAIETRSGVDALKRPLRRRRQALRQRLELARWDGTALSVYSTPNRDSPILQGDVRCSGSTYGSTRTPQVPEQAPGLSPKA
jgi:hypothetical protein